jgi:hypothetical protein
VALKKVNTMPPPMSSVSAFSSRLSITPSLSETFDPPSTTTYGRAGSDCEATQHIDLGDQTAHGGRQDLRDVVHAGLLAVDHAEPVGDEGIREGGEFSGEGGPHGVVLAGLARVEAHVLQQATSPSDRGPATVARAESPTVSVANETSRPSSSPSRAATGAGSTSGRARPSGDPGAP